jgi:hypothetical protein
MNMLAAICSLSLGPRYSVTMFTLATRDSADPYDQTLARVYLVDDTVAQSRCSTTSRCKAAAAISHLCCSSMDRSAAVRGRQTVELIDFSFEQSLDCPLQLAGAALHLVQQQLNQSCLACTAVTLTARPHARVYMVFVEGLLLLLPMLLCDSICCCSVPTRTNHVVKTTSLLWHT